MLNRGRTIPCIQYTAPLFASIIKPQSANPKCRVAVKGKNAGKALPPRKKQPGITPVKRILDAPHPSANNGINPRLMVYGETRVLELINLYWSDFSSVSFPHELTPESRPLIHRCKAGITTHAMRVSTDDAAGFKLVAESLYPP